MNLIFDRCDSIMFPPVKRFWEVNIRNVSCRPVDVRVILNIVRLLEKLKSISTLILYNVFIVYLNK